MNRNQSPAAGRSARHRLVGMAVAEAGAGVVTRALQSESPDGLAHSAIAAHRRGDPPRQDAQRALDAVLAWRDAWDSWWVAYGPYHRLVSRHQAAASAAHAAAERAHTAREVLRWYGGPLGTLTERDAALRLRGAFAQKRGVAAGGSEAWQGELAAAASSVRLSGSLPSWNGVISPDGRTVDDAARGRLDAGPLLAAWARLFGPPGMRRAARRWATAVADPILAAAPPVAAAAAEAERKLAATTVVETAGGDAVRQIIAAADRAEQAGVRIGSHQQGTVNYLKRALRAG